MITKIKDAGYALNPTAEEALRDVGRHLFVPDAGLAPAHENHIVITKRRISTGKWLRTQCWAYSSGVARLWPVHDPARLNQRRA
jgi:hypothetical protein